MINTKANIIALFKEEYRIYIQIISQDKSISKVKKQQYKCIIEEW